MSLESNMHPLTPESDDLGSTDSDLVHRAQQGEEAALHEVVDRHAAGLFRLAFSLVGNAADAEDVVQETFLGAFRGLSGFRGRSSLKTWLTRILMRQAARHHRSRAVRDTVSLDGLPDATAPSTRSVDARLDVAAALDTLSPEHRQVILLRELQGMTYAEMADVLDVPRGTVESRLHRARRALQDQLGDYLP